jgi:hypothetical protein
MEKNKEKDYATLPFRLKLFSDHVLTTCFTKDVTEKGIILNEGKGEVLTKQRVMFCGPASGLNPGDEVELNSNLFPKKAVKNKYDVGSDQYIIVPPVEIIQGYAFLYVGTREIKWAYDKTDVVPGVDSKQLTLTFGEKYEKPI